MAEYIERRMAYSLAKKVCEAVDSNPRVLLPQIILDLIDDVPTADVQPVRHGRWSREKNCETGYEIWVNVCSACGAITPVNVSRYKYCPNCGARMDTEEPETAYDPDKFFGRK